MTPVLSVPAFHVSETDVDVGVVAARLLGAVGGARSMIHVKVAGDGSATPPAVESTENVCDPAARPVIALGLEHATHALPSTRQVKVAVLSVEWKVNVADVDFVGLGGPLSMIVAGAGFASTAFEVPSSTSRTIAIEGTTRRRAKTTASFAGFTTATSSCPYARAINGLSWHLMGACPQGCPGMHALDPLSGRRASSNFIAMAVAVGGEVDRRGAELFVLEPLAADPLGFLAGLRFTCYCGRSLVGSILCADCAQEMTDYFSAARRRGSASDHPEGAFLVT